MINDAAVTKHKNHEVSSKSDIMRSPFLERAPVAEKEVLSRQYPSTPPGPAKGVATRGEKSTARRYPGKQRRSLSPDGEAPACESPPRERRRPPRSPYKRRAL